MKQYDDWYPRMRAGDDPWWRWKRASDLATFNEQPDYDDDAATLDAWRFQMAVADPKRTPTAEVPDSLAVVHSIYVDNGPRRWEIEARLLAGIDPTEIARRLNLSTEIIDRYTATFFDVISRLHCHDWIWLYAVRVGPNAPAKLSEGDIWRQIAVGGGPLILDILIGDYLKLPEPVYEDRAELAEDIRVCVRFSTTTMTDKREFRQIMKRMWYILARRKGTMEDMDWEMLAGNLRSLEAAAGLPGDTAIRPKAIHSKAASSQLRHASRDAEPVFEQLIADHAAYYRR